MERPSRRRTPLTTTTRREPDAVVLELFGEVRSGRGDVQLRTTLQDVIEGGPEHLVVVTTGLDLIDSAGLGELMAVHHRIRRRGRRFAVANNDPWIRDLLAMTRLDAIFPVRATVEDALETVREGSDALFSSADGTDGDPLDGWPID